jgi:hypothetical protein
MSKVKALFLAANPAGTDVLLLDEEIREITAKIRSSEYRDALELIARWAVRPDDLLQALLENKPHIVHFSGHGGPAAKIILQNQTGQPKPVSTPALVHLFRTLKDNIRVILLNACSTRPQAKALAQTIDCVIGMNRPIGDDAAIVFAASFYRAIGFGRTVQEAFDLAKAALLLEGIPEHKTPEIYVRDGVDASALVLVAPPSKAGENAVQPPEVPRGDAAKPLPATDRLSFLRTLGGLGPPDFELFVAAIPDASRHVSRQGTIPEKAAELVRFAEGPTGPGFDALLESLASFCDARRG